MSPFMGAEVAELGECLSAGRDGAGVGFLAGVRAQVDFEMGGLGEGFGAVGVGAEVAAGFVGCVGAGAGRRSQ